MSHIKIAPSEDGAAVSITIDGREVADKALVEGFSIVPADRPGHFRVTFALEGTLELEDHDAEVVTQ